MKSKVQFFQELSYNAWPAERSLLLNGWLIRVSEGITNRANSVLPLCYQGTDVTKDIVEVEKIYLKNKLPIIFQIPDYYEPSNLLEKLIENGYNDRNETIVMESKVTDMLLHEKNIDFVYKIEDNLTMKWFEFLKKNTNTNSERLDGIRKIIERISFKKISCTVEKSGEIFCQMLGVIERNHLGVYNMITHLDFRRKGMAQSMLTGLIYWAKQNEISNMYLQVEKENLGAIKLYSNVGFKELYRYRYLEKKA